MTCSLCEPIGDEQIANTGRGYYLGAPASSMKGLGPSHDDELRQCPTCGDLFLYTSEQAQTGSGNNDDDTITRFPAEASATLNAAGTLPLPELAARIAAIPYGVGRRHLDMVIPRDVLWALVPHFLDVIANGGDRWVAELVRLVADRDAAHVKSAFASRPAVPVLEPLHRYARIAGCSICTSVRYWPPTSPPHALRPMNITAEHDYLECPECDSLFEVQNTGGVTRVNEGLPKAAELRAARKS